MVSTWYFKVIQRKGLAPEVIRHYMNLYEQNFSIVVVNGIRGRCIKNVRMSVGQGNKFAMKIFAFGMDPILDYLMIRLKGIRMNSQIAQGP